MFQLCYISKIVLAIFLVYMELVSYEYAVIKSDTNFIETSEFHTLLRRVYSVCFPVIKIVCTVTHWIGHMMYEIYSRLSSYKNIT
jgi:hypothetical protein